MHLRNFIKSILALTCLLISSQSVADELRLPALFESTQRAVLSASQPGMLTVINKQVGDAVKRGDLLFALDTRDLEADAKLAGIRANYATKKLARQQQLQKRGMAAPALVAEAQQERDVAKTEVSLLQKRIKWAKRYAPYSGVIIERSAEPHEWVQAGQPVLALLNNEQLRLSVSVPSRVLSSLQAQQTYYAEIAALTANGVPGSVAVTLIAIAPKVEPQSDTAQVLWAVTNAPQDLLAGMRGELIIPTIQQEAGTP